jgi:predicted permease
METFLSDLRHSFRVLIKSPGFTIVAVLALALGIGANTAIFSVIDRVLLRPLPFPESERMMRVQRSYANGDAGSSVSIPKFMAWRKAQAFQSMAAYDFATVTVNLGAGDRPDPINVVHVTSGFFDVFGVRPMLGRTFTPEEDLPHSGKVAVLTFNLWKNRLGGSPEMIGRTLTLNSEQYVVLGILEEHYQPDPPADLYLPQQFDPNSTNQGHIYPVAGRLRPGATITSAKTELKVIGDRFRAAYPDAMDKDEGVAVIPLRVAIGGQVRPALLMLTGAVSFVLLIACANVANLLLARAAGRQREMAIRTAVGASRGRIVRQLLTESLLLAIAGGIAGLFLGGVGVRLLLAFSPGNIPRINDPEHSAAVLTLLDWRVLAFLFAISLFTGLLFGLLPALRVSRFDVNASLKEASGRSGTGTHHNRLRAILVISEISLAVVLLAGAALMLRTFAGLRSVNTGLDATNVLTMKTSVSGPRYATTVQEEAMVRQAIERIEALPGVEFAGCAVGLPMSDVTIDLPFSIEGRAPKLSNKWEGDEQWRFVSMHYFEALKIPLLRGRLFERRDTGKSDRVMIVNDAFAKKFFPNQEALGQRLNIGKGLGPDFEEAPREIVGIVGSVTEVGPGNGKVPVMYVPQGQTTDGITKLAGGLVPLSWVIRTKGDPFSVATLASREFQSLDPQLAPSKILTMEKVIADSTTRENFNVLLLTIFAVLALSLAAVGIYGLMSYAVQQRTQEIGIRMALGANQTKIMGMVVRQSMRLAAIGTVIGLVLAFGMTRLLSGFLFGVKSTDPVTYFAVVVILAAVALVATMIPARRAMRVDPIRALRQE